MNTTLYRLQTMSESGPTSTVKSDRPTRKLPVWLLRVTKRPSRTWIGELLSDENLLQIASLIRVPTSVSKFKTSCRRCTAVLPAPTCGQCKATADLTVCHTCDGVVTCLDHAAYSCGSCGSVACAACVPAKCCAGCGMYVCAICEICNCN